MTPDEEGPAIWCAAYGAAFAQYLFHMVHVADEGGTYRDALKDAKDWAKDVADDAYASYKGRTF